MDLHGKNILVTGGAIRIGREIVSSLASLGANLAIHYHRSEAAAEELVAELQSQNCRAVAVQGDLNQGKSVADEIVKRAVAGIGCLDILINSAAIFEPGNVLDTDEDQYDRHLNINLKAPFFLSQAFAKQCSATEETPGAIINLVDWRGTSPPGTHTAYTLSKAGLVALTRSLALELAPHVRVNAIAPGAILPPSGANESEYQKIVEKIPLAKTGNPAEIVKAVQYFLSADFVTGEILHITGGQQL